MDAVESWHDFNVAIVGAAAALAGLVIVAASVNIGDIVKETSLTSRLASGISGLVLALTASAIGLMPAISDVAYGVSVLIVAAGFLAFPVQAARRIVENRHPENRARFFKVVLGLVAPLAYLIGGVMLAVGMPGGLLLFAIGSILSIVAALMISWVVLVEVLR
ncbi:MAG: hypothetical protein J0I43_11035 [Microbacterium sp.]|uniref:hypothetical protein n=1 Tax=Microbacterium sp. TaxID=51671 RepID=UPI001AC335DA|nr:hypothetical protein [Microbacterium sp.]MBN9177889.1 hypothetical protein [Microbacterium sp.]